MVLDVVVVVDVSVVELVVDVVVVVEEVVVVDLVVVVVVVEVVVVLVVVVLLVDSISVFCIVVDSFGSCVVSITIFVSYISFSGVIDGFVIEVAVSLVDDIGSASYSYSSSSSTC